MSKILHDKLYEPYRKLLEHIRQNGMGYKRTLAEAMIERDLTGEYMKSFLGFSSTDPLFKAKQRIARYYFGDTSND